MARRLNNKSPRSPMATAINVVEPQNEAAVQLFDQFCAANTFQGITSTFQQICELCDLRPADNTGGPFYKQLKPRLTSWKAQSLWAKLDKRAGHREYKKGAACSNTRVLVIGGGPVGLRVAIEVALMGGKAVIVEKRDRLSRNNVLHLWPFVIHDLKVLGAKKFFGKFCAGSIDHISIRTLQCILLKAALLMGVEIHAGVTFESLAEPPVPDPAVPVHEQIGWRAKVKPVDHPVAEYQFDVLIGADGKRNTVQGFKRKEFRGKLAIAITANFINRNSQLEARVEEISGVAYIFNQKFFKDLNAKTGIDLENIVYYKDETHYFVMTAKKHSLLYKGVMRQDYEDPAKLLSRDNVNQEALMDYAKEAADVSTCQQLPSLDFAHNHYGQPDVAMFDFTSIFHAEHASRVVERHGKRLLVGLVGDSLLEPFWPTGSGCARGFLGALDASWMIRSWASGKMTPLEVMAERESIYQLLSQTTPENLSKNFSHYTMDPNTRYRTLNMHFFKPHQMRGLYEGVEKKYLEEIVQLSEQNSKKYDLMRDSHYLLKWYQRQLETYRSSIKILDLTTSFRNGIALCALIHKYRPELINVFGLDPNKVAANNQRAFDVALKEFGIQPVMTGEEMASMETPDRMSMLGYLSEFYEYFRKECIRPAKMAKTPEQLEVGKGAANRPKSPSSRQKMLDKMAKRIRQRRASSSDSELGHKARPRHIWSSDEDLGNSDSDEYEAAMEGKENDGEGLKRQRQPPTFTHGLAKKKLREEIPGVPGAGQEHSAFLSGYKRLEAGTGQPDEYTARYERIRKEMAAQRVDAKVGVRGANKVHYLAKDLAGKFSGRNLASLEERYNMASTYEEIWQEIRDPKVDSLRIQERGSNKVSRMASDLSSGRSFPSDSSSSISERVSYDDVWEEIRDPKVDPRNRLHRGSNKVSALAAGLANKFESSRPQQFEVPKIPSSSSSKAPGDLCYFCKSKVYLVERHTAEGLYFHRNCFRCDYCTTTLRMGAYAFKKGEGDKPPRFFCPNHAGREKTTRKPRKRSFGEKDLRTLASLEPTPTVTPPRLTPGDAPDSATAAAGAAGGPASSKNTPERIEFDIESEMEESEFEQTAHNLSGSLLSLDEEDSDSDDSSEDDDDVEPLAWSDGDVSDGDVSWADLAKSYRHQLKAARKKARIDAGEDEDDTDSDTATIGASDADWETDTETERDDEENGEGRRKKKGAAPPPAPEPPKETKPSPSTVEVRMNRLAFFSVPSEPVRINAFDFLGLRPKIEPKPPEPEPVPEPEPEPEPEVVPEPVEEKVGSGSGSADTSTSSTSSSSSTEMEALNSGQKREKQRQRERRRLKKRVDEVQVTNTAMMQEVPVVSIELISSTEEEVTKKEQKEVVVEELDISSESSTFSEGDLDNPLDEVDTSIKQQEVDIKDEELDEDSLTDITSDGELAASKSTDDLLEDDHKDIAEEKSESISLKTDTLSNVTDIPLEGSSSVVDVLKTSPESSELDIEIKEKSEALLQTDSSDIPMEIEPVEQYSDKDIDQACSVEPVLDIKDNIAEPLLSEQPQSMVIKEEIVSEQPQSMDIKEELVSEQPQGMDIKEEIVSEQPQSMDIKEEIVSEQSPLDSSIVDKESMALDSIEPEVLESVSESNLHTQATEVEAVDEKDIVIPSEAKVLASEVPKPRKRPVSSSSEALTDLDDQKSEESSCKLDPSRTAVIVSQEEDLTLSESETEVQNLSVELHITETEELSLCSSSLIDSASEVLRAGASSEKAAVGPCFVVESLLKLSADVVKASVPVIKEKSKDKPAVKAEVTEVAVKKAEEVKDEVKEQNNDDFEMGSSEKIEISETGIDKDLEPEKKDLEMDSCEINLDSVKDEEVMFEMDGLEDTELELTQIMKLNKEDSDVTAGLDDLSKLVAENLGHVSPDDSIFVTADLKGKQDSKEVVEEAVECSNTALVESKPSKGLPKLTMPSSPLKMKTPSVSPLPPATPPSSPMDSINAWRSYRRFTKEDADALLGQCSPVSSPVRSPLSPPLQVRNVQQSFSTPLTGFGSLSAIQNSPAGATLLDMPELTSTPTSAAGSVFFPSSTNNKEVKTEEEKSESTSDYVSVKEQMTDASDLKVEDDTQKEDTNLNDEGISVGKDNVDTLKVEEIEKPIQPVISELAQSQKNVEELEKPIQPVISELVQSSVESPAGSSSPASTSSRRSEKEAIERIDRMLERLDKGKESSMDKVLVIESYVDQSVCDISEQSSSEAAIMSMDTRAPVAPGESSGSGIGEILSDEKSPAAENPNSSIVEVKFDDSGREKSLIVDEKFVTKDRGKRSKPRKPHKVSPQSDSSSFTISTPSGSIEDTSSITELESAAASSGAPGVTPSTTGDSFSAVKLHGLTPSATDDSISFDRLAAMHGDETLSLDNLVEENADSEDLADMGIIRPNKRTLIDKNLISVDSSSSSTLDSLNSKSFRGDIYSQSVPKNYGGSKWATLPASLPSSKDSSFGSPMTPVVVNASTTDDSSMYYTPDVSGVEAMETDTAADTSDPKSWHGSDTKPMANSKGRITKSNDTLDTLESLDERLSDGKSIYSDQSQSSAVSPNRKSLIELNRRKFFFEEAQPLRIDPKNLFEDLRNKQNKAKKNKVNEQQHKRIEDVEKEKTLNLKKEWETLGHKTPTSPTAGIPHSNSVNGESDVFYTPATTMKQQPARQGVDGKADVRKKLIGEGVAMELTLEQQKQLFEEKQSKSRDEARDRARLMSDEELGISSSSSTQRKNGMLASTSSEKSQPETLKSQISTTSTHSSDSGKLSGSPRPSRPVSSSSKSPKRDRKMKGKSPKKLAEEEKENRKGQSDTGERKEKRRSFLAMLIPSKSSEKHDKEKTPKSPGIKTSQVPEWDKKKSPKSGDEKSKRGVMFRPKSRKKKEETPEPEQRISMYEEMQPMLESLKKKDEERKATSVKQRIEEVAPPPNQYPNTALAPPKATIDEFDTESEFGDTISLRSYQSNASNASTEDLSRLIRKQQKAMRRKQREEEMKRLRMAQEIQRQLEEVEIRRRDVESKGIAIEIALRGEGPDAGVDESRLMQDWFNVVHEKNVLVRYESELMVHGRELELEDRHARLEQQLRDRMSTDGDDEGAYGEEEGKAEEARILQELLEVVEQRDALVKLLEDDRLREKEHERDLREMMSARGFSLSPITYANRMRLPSLGNIHGPR